MSGGPRTRPWDGRGGCRLRGRDRVDGRGGMLLRVKPQGGRGRERRCVRGNGIAIENVAPLGVATQTDVGDVTTEKALEGCRRR